MLKIISILIFTAFNLSAEEINCSQHPIYCQIKANLSKARTKNGGFRKIEPWMTEKQMMDLSNVIYEITRKYDIPANLYTAMLRQESTYKMGAKNCRLGVDKEWNEVKTCADFGISMINIRTAKNFKFDLKRLTQDMKYSIECGAIVLADFKKRYFHKEEFWWTRYNASTPYKRQFYRGLVEDFLYAQD